MSILNQLTENVRFRINSARQMLLGTGNAQEAQPLERRREIMRRQRELLTGGSSGGSDDGYESRRAHDRQGPEIRRESGQVSGDGDTRETTSARRDTSDGQTTRQSRAPSMSDVNRGTAERAEERGF